MQPESEKEREIVKEKKRYLCILKEKKNYKKKVKSGDDKKKKMKVICTGLRITSVFYTKVEHTPVTF